MKSERVPFLKLQQLLLDHGFVMHHPSTGYYVFVHESSDTWITVPGYAPDQQVALHHLVSTRRMLDERGLLSTDEFDALIAETNVAA